ncbi:MAG: hypothetical protein FWF92_02140 [Oscillospiraceae bacterium]|nr:hypothetical protein [Oscillospiraceae bacterium]
MICLDGFRWVWYGKNNYKISFILIICNGYAKIINAVFFGEINLLKIKSR